MATTTDRKGTAMTTATRSENIAHAVETGTSPVGYVVVAALIFDGATVDSVTVHRSGDVERTALVTVDGADGPTTFYAVDGRWYDSAGIVLAAFDSLMLDRYADHLAGHVDEVSHRVTPQNLAGGVGPFRAHAASAILAR